MQVRAVTRCFVNVPTTHFEEGSAKMNRNLAMSILLAAAFINANAEEVLAGTIGNPGAAASKLSCTVFNGDDTAITIVSKKIFAQVNPPTGFYFDDCPKNLGPGRLCGFAANIENNQQYGCKVTFLGSKRSVRGSVTFTDSAGTTLTSGPMD